MGQLLAHVLKDKKTGRLSYRRPYPPELLPFLDTPPDRSTPPKELKRSLKAASLAEGDALDIWREANAEWEANVAAARKRKDAAYDPLTTEHIGYLAKLFVHEWREADRKALETRGDAFAIPARNFWEEKLSDFVRWQGEGDTDEIVEHWSKSAEGLLANRRFVRDPQDAVGFERLCKALNAGAVDYAPDALAALGGSIVPAPPPPSPPSSLEGPKSSGAAEGVSFEDIAEKILENPLRKVGPATKQAARTALRFFREGFLKPVPARITKAAVTDWLQLLGQRPAKLPAAHRELLLKDVVELYRDQDVPRLTHKTLMTHLGALAALWTKAQEEDGLIPEELLNPFKARKYLVAEKPEEPKQLSLDELHAIFALPVFTAGDRPTQGKGEACYWIPLLLLWTGARPEEIAQLMVSDVFQDPDAADGSWRLRITDEGVHPHKGARSLKTAKGKRAGRREFPVPKAMLDLNFLGYVEHVKASGETALFPKLRTKGERKLLFQGFSEWWNGIVQEKGILPAGQGRRAAREFRHNWTSAARASGIPEDAREYIQGHYRSGATANEGYGSRKSLGRYIDDLEYSGLDLSGVKPWKPR